MTKPQVRYYVGKFKNDKRGVHHRVVRRTSKLGKLFSTEHVYERGAWLKTKEHFTKASAFVPTREQARNLKGMLDSKL